MATGQIGEGTTLGYSAVPATTYTTVGDVFDVSFPDLTVADVKDTNYDTASHMHSYIAGWIEGGVVTFQVSYSKAEHATLEAFVRVKKTWKITLPDGGNYIWVGYINKMGGAIPNEDRMTVSFSIKICTLPTFATS
jgi:hypothetical protein